MEKAEVGIQVNGMSPTFIKRMALEAVKAAGTSSLNDVADIGGGWGELSLALSPISKAIHLVDFSPPSASSLPPNIVPLHGDLNKQWPLDTQSIDFSFSTEVIEHIENPRHFMRELVRITRPGGFIFITTPNNHSLISKLVFLLRGEHRYFQDASYPAHITPLLCCDIKRMGAEVGLSFKSWFWSGEDKLPCLGWRIPLGGPMFSMSVGALFQVPLSVTH
jgi:2-polyprenyl-3-methyl-5-hydroxy-6-metoxy-1,4-benzoquinol methylase